MARRRSHQRPVESLAAVIAFTMLMAQLPMFSVRVGQRSVGVGPLQVAGAMYAGTNEAFVKFAYTPGWLLYKAAAATRCALGSTAWCKPMGAWDDMLDSYSPLYVPKVLQDSIKDTFSEREAGMLLLGSILCVVTSTYAVFAHTRLGLFGAGMILAAVHRQSSQHVMGFLIYATFVAITSGAFDLLELVQGQPGEPAAAPEARPADGAGGGVQRPEARRARRRA